VNPWFLINGLGPAPLALLARQTNDGMAREATRLLEEALQGLDGRTVLILGLAYRGNVKEPYHSAAFLLNDALRAAGARVLVHDPLFSDEEISGQGLAPASLEPPPVEPPPRPFDYAVVNSDPPRRVPSATRVFWITDGTTGERREITARLRVQTERVAMWVEDGIWHDVRQLEEAAAFFDTQVISITRAAFGSEWTPGVDNDPHIAVLHATGLGEGVMGYTSSADEFSRDVYPLSNEAEMITVHADTVEVGSPAYYGLLARQYQRLIQWFQDRNEERWVKEGLAELAVRLNGLDPGETKPAYLERPDTSLTAWEDEAAAAHRGAASLFAIYFHERFGDAGTRALTAQPLNGTAGFDAALAELEAGLSFEDLFAEWLAANALDSQAGASRPRYGYATLDLEGPPAPAAIYEDYPVGRRPRRCWTCYPPADAISGGRTAPTSR